MAEHDAMLKNFESYARSTQGVKLVSLEDGDKVAAASSIPDAENVDGNGQETLPIQ